MSRSGNGAAGFQITMGSDGYRPNDARTKGQSVAAGGPRTSSADRNVSKPGLAGGAGNSNTSPVTAGIAGGAGGEAAGVASMRQILHFCGS